MPSYLELKRAAKAANVEAAAERVAERLAAGFLTRDCIIQFTDERCGHTWRSMYSKDTVVSSIRSCCYACHTGFNDADFVPPSAIITDPKARPTRPYRLDPIIMREVAADGKVTFRKV